MKPKIPRFQTQVPNYSTGSKLNTGAMCIIYGRASKNAAAELEVLAFYLGAEQSRRWVDSSAESLEKIPVLEQSYQWHIMMQKAAEVRVNKNNTS